MEEAGSDQRIVDSEDEEGRRISSWRMSMIS
jgi:hypothetical protein